MWFNASGNVLAEIPRSDMSQKWTQCSVHRIYTLNRRQKSLPVITTASSMLCSCFGAVSKWAPFSCCRHSDWVKVHPRSGQNRFTLTLSIHLAMNDSFCPTGLFWLAAALVQWSVLYTKQKWERNTRRPLLPKTAAETLMNNILFPCFSFSSEKKKNCIQNTRFIPQVAIWGKWVYRQVIHLLRRTDKIKWKNTKYDHIKRTALEVMSANRIQSQSQMISKV